MHHGVDRLDEAYREAIARHLEQLDADDLRLRFGCRQDAQRLAAYVAAISFERDAIFGVHGDDLALLGVAHLVIGEHEAEVGLSVLPAHRRTGIGRALLDRACTHARNRGIRVLFMHCLAENEAMTQLARQLGVTVVTHHPESEAHLALPPGNLLTLCAELAGQQLALVDWTLKASLLRPGPERSDGAPPAAEAP